MKSGKTVASKGSLMDLIQVALQDSIPGKTLVFIGFDIVFFLLLFSISPPDFNSFTFNKGIDHFRKKHFNDLGRFLFG
jgi:hypothetical protein